MGDFNAQLPHKMINSNYKLVITNTLAYYIILSLQIILFKQTCILNNIQGTHISVLNEMDKLKLCNIMPFRDHNVSDHFPIRMVYVLFIPPTRSKTVSNVQENNQYIIIGLM